MDDGCIAATARRHRLTIVTGNDKDFRRPGLKVFKPSKENDRAESLRGRFANRRPLMWVGGLHCGAVSVFRNAEMPMRPRAIRLKEFFVRATPLTRNYPRLPPAPINGDWRRCGAADHEKHNGEPWF